MLYDYYYIVKLPVTFVQKSDINPHFIIGRVSMRSI